MDWRWLFGGRIDRFTYWRMVAVHILVAFLILAVLAHVTLPPSPPALGFAVELAIVLGIIIIIPAFAIGAKRLHDRDKSAWWLLLFYGVPDVLLGIGIYADLANEIATHCLFVSGWAAYSGRQCPGSWTATVFVVAALAIEIWTLVELGCLRGTVGTNRYGPEPLEREEPSDIYER